MSENKSDDFSKKAKTAFKGFGSEAGKVLQNVREQAATMTEKAAQQIKSTARKATDAIEGKINDAKSALDQNKDGSPPVIRFPGSEIVLLLSEGYQRQKPKKLLKAPFAGVGLDPVVLQKTTSGSENTVKVFWPFQMAFSLPHDAKSLIDQLHQDMTDRQGLIEVKEGATADGHSYLYSLTKTLSHGQPGREVCYSLGLTIFSDTGDVRVTGEFQEAGAAETRASQCIELAIQAGIAQITDHSSQNWAQDPYDPGFKKGVLKNLSEKEGLDVLFPEHPLSQARELLLAVLEHRLVKSDEEKPGEDVAATLFVDECKRSIVPADPDKEISSPENAQEPPKRAEIKPISTRNAIKIIYYLMAADGEIFHREEEKFDVIGSELDPDFAEDKEQIVKECRAQMEKVIDSEDYYDVLQDGVELAISSSVRAEDTFITPKLLVWDLLTIAYSDESYDDSERRLIKYIVRKLDIDKAVFLEMESSILTLMDLERELNWIKTTDRPYLTIENMVNELADRKNVIFESVKQLIAL